MVLVQEELGLGLRASVDESRNDIRELKLRPPDCQWIRTFTRKLSEP